MKRKNLFPTSNATILAIKLASTHPIMCNSCFLKSLRIHNFINWKKKIVVGCHNFLPRLNMNVDLIVDDYDQYKV